MLIIFWLKNYILMLVSMLIFQDGVAEFSSYSNNAPDIEKVVQSSDNLNEYGYGFWMRFLTAYP